MNLKFETRSRPQTGWRNRCDAKWGVHATLVRKVKKQTTAEHSIVKGVAYEKYTRLPHVYGAKSLLFYQIRQGRVIFPGKGDNLFAHLHVCDAARALIKAAESGKRGVYVVADNLSCTWNQLFEMTQSYYPRLRVVHIPKWLALMATGAIELMLKFKKSPNRFTMIPKSSISVEKSMKHFP